MNPKRVWVHVTVLGDLVNGEVINRTIRRQARHWVVEGTDDADALERFAAAAGFEAEYWVPYRTKREALAATTMSGDVTEIPL